MLFFPSPVNFFNLQTLIVDITVLFSLYFVLFHIIGFADTY